MFDVEAGERRSASLMLAHAFSMGLATVFFETAASALFLTRFPPAAIPLVYIAAAVVSTLTGLGYKRLERRVAFWPLMAGTIVFLCATVLMFRVAISFTNAAAVIFGLFVWYRLLSILTDLEYWAVATRLYDLRQAKRLFGFIGSGEVTARMLGAFAVPVLVHTIGTNNLIVLSGIALFVCLMLLLAIRRHDASVIKTTSEASRANPQSSGVLSDPYVRSIIAVAVLGILGKHFVDFSFLQQMQSHYADAGRLASFFGIFSGVTQAVNLLIRVTVSGRYLQRFGIGAGLGTLPAAHVVCTIVLVVVATIHPGAAGVFWLVVFNQGIYKTLKHPIDNPSIKVLYQPLRRESRLAVQVINEVIATPLAIGVAGCVMLLFTRVMHFDIRIFGLVMLLTFVLWIVSSRLAWRRYVDALRMALQKRHVDPDALTVSDEAGLVSIRAHATSTHPEEAIYALTLLERSGDTSMLDEATRHPSVAVQAHARTRLATREILDDIGGRRQRLLELAESDPALARAMIEEAHDPPLTAMVAPVLVERAMRDLHDRDRRSSAIATLVVAGEHALAAIAAECGNSSPAQIERLLRIAGRIGGLGAKAIVLPYLSSADERLRGGALAALVAMNHRPDHHLLESMIRSDAAEAVGERALHDSIPNGEPYTLVRSALAAEVERARLRILLALSLIGDAPAIERARRQLQSSSRERRAYAAELLDASVPPNLRGAVLPLFRDHVASTHSDPADGLQRMSEGVRCTPWTQAAARYAIDRLKGNLVMNPTIEKVLILKSIDLFARTPDDVLAQLAAELESIEVVAGDPIIRKGDIGDSLYVIISGQVRVHDGNTVVAQLGDREIFGELAVLDPEPRSASVTAETNVALFRLDRDDLFELLPDHIEIAHGIFHVLCRRLRGT
jgi:Cyclic nucleotide-binding domain